MKPPIDYTILMDCPPCPRCLALSPNPLDIETVQPLPPGARAPMGYNGEPCCYDCADADSLLKFKGLDFVMARIAVVKFKGLDFVMARIAVGNDRREQLRWPGAPMGLVYHHLMRPNQGNAFNDHWAWLDKWGLISQDDERA